MLSLLLATTLAASQPSAPLTDGPTTVECTADRLKQFVGPLGTAQAWPAATELPGHLHPEAGVVLSGPGQVMDGYQQVLHVDETTRSAYVVQQGGFAGQVSVYGPLPVAACSRVAP